MNQEWQRTKTTRRYVSPPLSERLYTFWREGKIVFGEEDIAVKTHVYRETIYSSGMWFIDGSTLSPFDFKDTQMLMREDGIPVHGQRHKLGNLDIMIECFSDFGIRPNCYVKVVVVNNTKESASEVLGFLLRSGQESKLTFSGPDLYAIYAPMLSDWTDITPCWCYDGKVFRDGEKMLTTNGDLDFDFSKETGLALSRLTLAPGESREQIFAFNIGEIYDFDYVANKHECISLWEKQLAKINKLPAKLKSDAEALRMIKNLTVQTLQCFCLPKGKDIVFARQGGLQRQIWLYETMPVLEALSEIGDFDEYIEPVIDSYFTEFMTESGEIIPLAIPWAMATANALYSFAKYANKKDKTYFEKYIDRAYKSFLWIKNTRAGVKAGENVYPGLFPPLASCDDQFVFQSWCSTDTFNIRGLSAFLDVCEKYGDTEKARAIRSERDDYIGIMRNIWRGKREEQRGKPLEVPYSPSLPDHIVKSNFAFGTPTGVFVEGLDLPVEESLEIVKTYTDKGIIRGGLYDKMPDVENSSGLGKDNIDEDGVCVVWYVCNNEYYWFEYFYRHKMYDKCSEIVRDTVKFAMTDEHYMFERYNRRNVWFAPWSPNASANGRLILMILKMFEK